MKMLREMRSNTMMHLEWEQADFLVRGGGDRLFGNVLEESEENP